MKESYELMRRAYCRIFDRIGLEYRMVEADSGLIGGDFSHEFMVLAIRVRKKFYTARTVNLPLMLKALLACRPRKRRQRRLKQCKKFTRRESKP